MVIAVALFGDEISPRFDCCVELAFVADQGDLCSAKRMRMKRSDSEARIMRLMDQSCRALLCGGIRHRDRLRLKASGITVIDGLYGPAHERLREYQNRRIINTMKIAITSTGRDLNADVDPRFGRAAQFIVIDPQTMNFEVVDNQQNLDLPQGAGIQAAKTIVDNQVEALLTGHCGPKAFHVLQSAGVKIYVNVKGTIMDAVTRFNNGEFKPASNANVGGHWA